MKLTKREPNKGLLIVRYLSPTNSRGARIKFIQCNTSNNVIINRDYSLDSLDQTFSILDKCDCIKSYSLLIDNTQSKQWHIMFEGFEGRIDNVISEIKK